MAAFAPTMDFVPPAAGTYQLQKIMRASNGAVLDTRGRSRKLSEFTRGKVTLLSFIYSSCADPGGCPYAYLVFHTLKSRIAKDSRLHGKVRLVSLSFDPKRDTPGALALYGKDHADAKGPVQWSFLTTRSHRELLPILDGYGQDVDIELDPTNGKLTGAFSHVLKVFLIDGKGVVREIYTTAYLMPEMVFNDIKTLIMEQEVKLQ